MTSKPPGRICEVKWPARIRDRRVKGKHLFSILYMSYMPCMSYYICHAYFLYSRFRWPELPFMHQDLFCLTTKLCVLLSQSNVQVGTEVEFALTSVNVVGKSSDRSESSPVYRVIGSPVQYNIYKYKVYRVIGSCAILPLNVLCGNFLKNLVCLMFWNAKETEGGIRKK